MQVIKRILIFLPLMLVLCSCSAEQYSSSVPCSDISRSIASVLDDGLIYAEYDSSWLSFNFDNSDLFEDCSVIYSVDAENINEIGVFCAADESRADMLEDLCEEYISRLAKDMRAFIASYSPHQLPLLDEARVQRLGSYVIYTVLPSDKHSAALSALKSSISQN